jgi:hypothetical protein
MDQRRMFVVYQIAVINSLWKKAVASLTFPCASLRPASKPLE